MEEIKIDQVFESTFRQLDLEKAQVDGKVEMLRQISTFFKDNNLKVFVEEQFSEKEEHEEKIVKKIKE